MTATVDLPTPPLALEANKVNLVPLWGGDESFSELTAKLHPEEVKGVRFNE